MKPSIENGVSATKNYMASAAESVMASAVEIAYTAGAYGFQTANSRDMMASFVNWAEEFEKTPYQDEDWLELIERFAVEMLVIEIERNAACHIGDRHPLPSINDPQNLSDWLSLKGSDWVYLPEHSDRILTKDHFVELCEGNVERAYSLFCMCEWQNPETIIDEAGGLEAFLTEPGHSITDAPKGVSFFRGNKMKKVKVSELSGVALDWAVAKSEGGIDFRYDTVATYWITINGKERALSKGWAQSFTPSTDWAQGGKIIERDGIALRKHSSGTWYATLHLGDYEGARWSKFYWVNQDVQKQIRFDGGTALEAAMRCFVASKLGVEVELPEGL